MRTVACVGYGSAAALSVAVAMGGFRALDQAATIRGWDPDWKPPSDQAVHDAGIAAVAGPAAIVAGIAGFAGSAWHAPNAAALGSVLGVTIGLLAIDKFVSPQ